MHGRVLAALALLFLPACGGVRPPLPPEIFPATTRWRLEFDVPPTSIVSDGRRVFIGLESGEIRAVDLISGNQAWSQRQQSGQLSAGGGLLLLRRPTGTIVFLDSDTGAERFRADSGVPGGQAAVVTGSEVLVTGDGVASIDVSDGRILWSVPPGGVRGVTPPVAAGRCVLIGEKDGNLRCRNRATGESSWVVNLGEGRHARALADERERIYVGTADRTVLALRGDRQGSRDWRWRIGGAAPYEAALLGERLMVATLGNVLYGLNRRNGHMVWLAPLPSRPLGPPLIFGSAVLVPCHERVVAAFDTNLGEPLGSLHAPGAFLDAPILVGDHLVMPLRDPWAVVAIQLAGGPAREP